MDRLDRIEKILEKVAESHNEADQQRAKDKAEAKAEADRRQKEWDQQRAKDKAEAETRQKEAETRQKEAETRQKEADRRLAENDRLIGELRASIKDLGKNVKGMGVSIGEITEAITVSGKIIELVNRFDGIEVDSFAHNLEKTYKIDPNRVLEGTNRRQFEIDGLALGESEAVVIEAKTKLNRGDIDSFIKGLERFKEAFGEYAGRDIYACVAFIRANDKTLAYAEKRGLFVIRATPPDVKLLNSKGFKPIKFA